MEKMLLEKLALPMNGLSLPEPLDGRTLLATNPKGKKWKKRVVTKLRGLVWHQELGWGSVESVARYHTGAKSHLHDGGVESIAYSWAIRRTGQIVLCNNLSKAVWSQGYAGRKGDENSEFMSVMFEGLFNGEGMADYAAGEPNHVQMLSGLILWHICKEAWAWKADDLYGHYLFGKAACPGNTLERIIEAVRINVEEQAFDLGTVKGRQAALNFLGYEAGTADGVWGPASKGALIRFQLDSGVAPDGIWGTQTKLALTKALI